MNVIDVIRTLEHVEREMKTYEFGADMAQKQLSEGLALKLAPIVKATNGQK